MSSFKKIAIALVLLLFFTCGAIWYLFGEEDYYPSPGSAQFYLRLSSVIRDLPIVAAEDAPLYYGSVGDGSKAPQSSVSYNSRENEQVLISQISDYLHQKQFTLDTPTGDAYPSANLIEGKILYQAMFVKGGGNESILFLIHSIPDTKQVTIEVTHFE